MGQHGYVVTNALAGLADAAFSWSGGLTTDRDKLHDGRMDARYGAGNLSSGENVIIDMGSATSLIGFAVLNHSLAPLELANTPQILIEAADDAGISVNKVTPKALTSLYTSTTPRNKDHVLQFAAVSKRWWKLTWSWSGGGTAAINVGELFAYSAINLLSRRSVYGSGEQQSWLVQTLQMQYGAMRSQFLGGPLRSLDFQWSDLTSSQRDELQGMWANTNGGAKPLLWVMSYENVATAAAVTEQECIFGRLTRPSYGWKESDFSLFQPDGLALTSEGREAGA